MKWGPGRLLFIHIARAASEDMKELPAAELIEGKGSKATDISTLGQYSPFPMSGMSPSLNKKFLMLWNRTNPPSGKSIILKPHEHRRNLTTQGVPLNYLVGKRFKIGETILEEDG